jgi:hypothetical protein
MALVQVLDLVQVAVEHLPPKGKGIIKKPC